jgi:hypothetical protein
LTTQRSAVSGNVHIVVFGHFVVDFVSFGHACGSSRMYWMGKKKESSKTRDTEEEAIIPPAFYPRPPSTARALPNHLGARSSSMPMPSRIVVVIPRPGRGIFRG